MRLTVHLLGVEVFAIVVNEPDEAETSNSLDGGTTSSYPVGFTRAEVPWEDSGSLHQFEPDETSED